MTRKGRARSPLMRVAVLLALTAVTTSLSGCYFGPEGFNPFASGGDMPERAEVFEVALENDYDFDVTLITTKYGDNEDQVIMEGPIVQMVGASDDPMREGWHIQKVEWEQLVWEKTDGQWTLVSGTKRGPRWFTGSLN